MLLTLGLTLRSKVKLKEDSGSDSSFDSGSVSDSELSEVSDEMGSFFLP